MPEITMPMGRHLSEHPKLKYLFFGGKGGVGKTVFAAAAAIGLARQGRRTLLASIEREQTVEGSYWSQESRHFVVRYEGAVGLDVGRSVVDGLEEAALILLPVGPR